MTEPDAYKRPTVGDRLGPDFSEHKEHRNWRGFEDEVEPLFSAETILELIQDIREDDVIHPNAELKQLEATIEDFNRNSGDSSE